MVPSKGKRRTGMIAVGGLLIAVGVLGGGALLVVAASKYEDAVKGLARAPIGCTTSLEFERAGTFLIFVETKGSIGTVDGDCTNADTDYAHKGAAPDIEVTLTDEAGAEIDVASKVDGDYDVANFVGSSIGSITIDDPGSFEITVNSDDTDVAVAIGKDPKDSAGNLGLIGIGVGALLAVFGLVLVILGFRRRPVAHSGGMGPGAGGVPTMGYTPTAPPPAYSPQPTYAPQPPLAPQPQAAPQPQFAPQPTYSPIPPPPAPGQAGPTGWASPPQT